MRSRSRELVLVKMTFTKARVAFGLHSARDRSEDVPVRRLVHLVADAFAHARGAPGRDVRGPLIGGVLLTGHRQDRELTLNRAEGRFEAHMGACFHDLLRQAGAAHQDGKRPPNCVQDADDGVELGVAVGWQVRLLRDQADARHGDVSYGYRPDPGG